MAGPFGDAGVDLFVLNGPLEESLAGLAGEKTVVVTRDLIATNRTEFLDKVLGIREVRGTGDGAGDDANLAEARVADGARHRHVLGHVVDAVGVVVGGRLGGGVGCARGGVVLGAVLLLALALVGLLVEVGQRAACGREQTGVNLLITTGRVVSLEEALAGLAGEQSVLIAGHLVAAHGAALLETRGVKEAGGFEAGHVLLRLLLVGHLLGMVIGT